MISCCILYIILLHNMISHYTIILFVTFILFFIEAIIHYNVGLHHNSDKNIIDVMCNVKLPTNAELLSLTSILLIFSLLNATIIDYLEGIHH